MRYYKITKTDENRPIYLKNIAQDLSKGLFE